MSGFLEVNGPESRHDSVWKGKKKPAVPGDDVPAGICDASTMGFWECEVYVFL